MALSDTPQPRSRDSRGREAAPGMQQVISLLLILHLFCVLLALSSYTRRSPLQLRLLTMLAPYTRTLNIAPAAAPFHLTQYDALEGDYPHDDEHFLELTFVGADGQPQTHNLNEAALAFPDARRRYRLLASEMRYSLALAGDENRLVQLGRAAAGYALRKHEATTGVLRLRHHLSQPRLLANLREGFPPDPTDPRYVVTVYEADVLLDESGEVLLVKREERGQVAPVVPAANAPPAAN